MMAPDQRSYKKIRFESLAMGIFRVIFLIILAASSALAA